MTSEGADAIISKVGGLVSEAIKQIEFKPGSPTTKVVPGFPFTVVGSFAEPITPSDDAQVAPWFPPDPYYSQGGNGGSNLFITPLDPSSTINGRGCYSSPLPFLFIPKDQERLLYLRQSFTVNSYVDESYVERESVTPGPASFELFQLDDIPETSSPPPAGGGFFFDPGDYTIYFLIQRFLGVDGGPARSLDVWGNNSDPVNVEVKNEDFLKNGGARQMMSLTGYIQMTAVYPVWNIWGKGINLGSSSAGDMSGYTGVWVQSFPPPS